MRYLLPAALVLVLFGAGCSSTDTSQSNTAPTAQTPAPEASSPDQTPPPTADSSTDMMGASSTMMNDTTSTSSTAAANPADALAMAQANAQKTLQNVMNNVYKFPGVLPANETANKQVVLHTTKGDITFDLLPDQGPNAASNFVYLANQKFYDGLTFHRVVPGFVIQGGDPKGDGTGGPGYQFNDDKVSLPYNAGIVAMANAGPNTNGSQFFIMLADNPLPPSYSIFGRVTSGMDVVQQIGVGDTILSATVENK